MALNTENTSCTKGFTLIEVMVAIAILAIALPALMGSMNDQLKGIGRLRDKTIAEMVAVNKMTEYRLLNKHTGFVNSDTITGIAKMANQDWYWSIDTKQSTVTEMGDLFLITITISKSKDGQPIVTLNGGLQRYSE